MGVCAPLASGHTPLLGERADVLRWAAYAAVAALFAWAIARYHVPGKGLTYLVEFGPANHARSLAELKAADHCESADPYGYDAQWYAQIAMHPRLGDPALQAAVDRLPYRARRILFEWTAWALGGGDPERAMNAYAWQGVACWFLLAALLLRWFPPVSWGNWFRWAAVLLSFGLVFSVRRALLDGPSLLLTASAMALLECGRPWACALLLGAGGLGKDTSILAGSALVAPPARTRGAWAAWLGRMALVALPLASWALCLRMWLGQGRDVGMNNFAGPLVGLWQKIEATASGLAADGWAFPSKSALDALVLGGLIAQLLFFAMRIRWREPWWRVGASFSVLMLFLGQAVWEGYPSAAARVLLPMTLAFNILVPRGRWWALLLLAGNLGVAGSADLLKPPNRIQEGFVVDGPRELRLNPADGLEVGAVFDGASWWPPEGHGGDFWRWSRADGTVTIRNPRPFPVVADVTFGMATAVPRVAAVTVGRSVAWRGALTVGIDNRASIRGLVLEPGDTRLEFRSDSPPVPAGPNDRRMLTFSVRDLTIRLTGRR